MCELVNRLRAQTFSMLTCNGELWNTVHVASDRTHFNVRKLWGSVCKGTSSFSEAAHFSTVLIYCN